MGKMHISILLCAPTSWVLLCLMTLIRPWEWIICWGTFFDNFFDYTCAIPGQNMSEHPISRTWRLLEIMSKCDMFWAVNTISVVTTPHIFYSSEDFNHFQPTFQKLRSFNLIIIHLSWELQGFFWNHPIDHWSVTSTKDTPPANMYVCIYIYTLSYNHRDLVGLERGNKNITFAPPGCFVGKKSSNLDHLLRQDLNNL